MTNKRQVWITIHYRGRFSLDEHRKRLGYAAYHWSILITPKQSRGADSYAYDVSDGHSPDQMTRADHNPNRDWVFREKPNVNPEFSSHLLGTIMIGKLPKEVSFVELEKHLRSVPVPVRGAEPEQNCVSWTRSAIRKLQEEALAEQFNVDKFMKDALRYADERIKDPKNVQQKINYTSRPM